MVKATDMRRNEHGKVTEPLLSIAAWNLLELCFRLVGRNNITACSLIIGKADSFLSKRASRSSGEKKAKPWKKNLIMLLKKYLNILKRYVQK